MQAIQLDENLIIRMAGGDGSAFRELYEQTASAVYGFALSILKNTHDAEDVMHDAFVKAYTAAVTYKPMGKPVAWLVGGPEALDEFGEGVPDQAKELARAHWPGALTVIVAAGSPTAGS